MCGFVGFTAVDYDTDTNKAVVKDMADRIAHRGPDDEGFFLRRNVGLGMRRLSIIDLAGGHQPIFTPDGSKVIVFNGEVYNFLDHRPELERRGHRFSTRTDTEVVLHLYDEYGLDFLEQANGMFGLATRRSSSLRPRSRRSSPSPRSAPGSSPTRWAST